MLHAKCYSRAHTKIYPCQMLTLVPYSRKFFAHFSTPKHAFPSSPSRTRFGRPSTPRQFIIVFLHRMDYHCTTRSANPVPRQYIPDIHLRQKLSQLPETNRLSYRANCRRGIDGYKYHPAFSVAIRGGRGDKSSRRLRLGRRSSGGRTVVDSACGTLKLAGDS